MNRADGYLRRGAPGYLAATVALFCAGFATFAALYCVQPLLPLLAAHFAVSAASSALALSLATLTLAASLLVWGALAERWGRKPVMLLALGLACAFGLGCAWVEQWPLLLLLRALLGLSLSGLPALAMAYVGEEFAADALPAAMGLYVGGTALGGLLGRLLAGVLGDWGGWQLALAAIALLGILCLGLFAWLLPPSRHFHAQPLALQGLLANYRRHLASAALRDLLGLAFVLMGSFVALFNYAGFRLTQAPFALGSAEVGLLFLVYLGGIFSAGWAGRLTTRLGARRVIRAGIALMLLGILACALPWLVAVVLGMALVTLGFFAAHAVASAQVSARAQGARAQASALYLGAYYLGSSVLGYAAGWVWQLAGWHALLGLLLALCLLALRQTRRL
jgi:YNFM family putative membrane transporter